MNHENNFDYSNRNGNLLVSFREYVKVSYFFFASETKLFLLKNAWKSTRLSSGPSTYITKLDTFEARFSLTFLWTFLIALNTKLILCKENIVYINQKNAANFLMRWLLTDFITTSPEGSKKNEFGFCEECSKFVMQTLFTVANEFNLMIFFWSTRIEICA